MVEQVGEPLTRFLFDSLKTKREINETFVADIIEIIVNALDLNECVRDYKIDNQPWDGKNIIISARYSYKYKKITLRLQATLEFYLHNFKYLRIDNQEKIAFIYDCIIQALLHELEHANQIKKIDFASKDLERVILGYTNIPILLFDHFYELVRQGFSGQQINDLIAEKNNISRKYYKYNTKERLAEYYSHKTMATILKKQENFPGVYYYECLKLYQNYRRGYQDKRVPTEFYFEMLGLSNFWPKIEASSQNLDFESRVALGLSISDDEYRYLSNTTIKLERIKIK